VLNVFKAVSAAEKLPIQTVIGATGWVGNPSLIAFFLSREGRNYPAETFVEFSEALEQKQAQLEWSLALYAFVSNFPEIARIARSVEARRNKLGESISLLTTFARNKSSVQGSPGEIASQATCCSLRYQWAGLFDDDDLQGHMILGKYQDLAERDKGRALNAIRGLVEASPHGPPQDHVRSFRIYKVTYVLNQSTC
jgi:hypothetical protein